MTLEYILSQKKINLHFLHLHQYKGINYVKLRGSGKEHACTAVSDIEEAVRIFQGIGFDLVAGNSIGYKDPIENLETEAKIEIPSCVSSWMIGRLYNKGAKFMGCFEEENTLFDKPDDSLNRQGCLLRLRTQKEINGKEETFLTFKGPKDKESKLKVRPEFEVKVYGEGILDLIEQMGYVKSNGYSKYRSKYILDNCEVCHDYLKDNLKDYVEIEGQEIDVWAVRKKLSLENYPLIKKSYADLVGKKD